MNILLTGATGFIGGHLLRVLLADNHRVTVVSRHPERLLRQFPGLDVIVLDFKEAAESRLWLPYLEGIDAVINAVGLIKESPGASFEAVHHRAPAALFNACAQLGIKKVVQISALGAELDAETAYFTSKAKADAHLQSLDLDWFIFKPSIVFGRGAKSMGLLAAMAALPVTPMLDGGQQSLQPVDVGDLCQAVSEALKPESRPRQIIHAVGPHPIRFAAIVELLANYLGRRLRPLPVSGVWIGALLPLTAWLDEPVLNKQSLAMLQRGNTAEADGFTVFLGRSPASLEQFLRAAPVSQAERWHARLYFLRPLLTLSIAMVWLWTGWVSAFIYPAEESYRMLSRVGIEGGLASVVLYGASLADFVLGLALLFRWRLRQVVAVQVAIMLAYMAVISIFLPEFWLHPFGPLIKNLPLLAATLIMLIIEEEKP
ncbi:MAG: NAD(P)H-binding protein [Methylomicrobium sp.]